MRTKGVKNMYKNMRSACRKISQQKITNTNGRELKNMSKFKQLEYYWLNYYIKYDMLMPYGYIIVIYRLRKNLKYRKKLIRKIKENKAFIIV